MQKEKNFFRLAHAWENCEIILNPGGSSKKADFSAKIFVQDRLQKVIRFGTQISLQGHDPGLPLTFKECDNFDNSEYFKYSEYLLINSGACFRSIPGRLYPDRGRLQSFDVVRPTIQNNIFIAAFYPGGLYITYIPL